LSRGIKASHNDQIIMTPERDREDRSWKILAGQDGKFLACHGNEKRELTFAQVFVLGHTLFQTRCYRAAHDVFAVISRVRGRQPCASIMLARCKAELDNFESCEEILRKVFRHHDAGTAEQFQAAFVFQTMGLYEDAIREFIRIVKQHPELAIAWLFLGDLFQQMREAGRATYCWKTAIQRDQTGGAITSAATKQLASLAEHPRQTSSAG
jgi:tetratricopeptide (TPR) repeat protein